jgi:hypothetical protein
MARDAKPGPTRSPRVSPSLYAAREGRGREIPGRAQSIAEATRSHNRRQRPDRSHSPRRPRNTQDVGRLEAEIDALQGKVQMLVLQNHQLSGQEYRRRNTQRPETYSDARYPIPWSQGGIRGGGSPRVMHAPPLQSMGPGADYTSWHDDLCMYQPYRSASPMISPRLAGIGGMFPMHAPHRRPLQSMGPHAASMNCFLPVENPPLVVPPMSPTFYAPPPQSLFQPFPGLPVSAVKRFKVTAPPLSPRGASTNDCVGLRPASPRMARGMRSVSLRLDASPMGGGVIHHPSARSSSQRVLPGVTSTAPGVYDVQHHGDQAASPPPVIFY